MSTYNLQPLTGMTEFTPAAQIQFERWIQHIRTTYARYGFTPIDTPALERSEILLAKAGSGTEQQIYRFTKGSTDMSLRFDLTVPLARYVAAHQQDLVFPFRRQAIAKVYRGEKAQHGRFREFYQADADIIGRNQLDLTYDAEIISLIVDTIRGLQLGDFTVHINNRKLVMGFLASLKVSDQAEVLHLLDSAEKIGATKLKSELQLLRLDAFEIRHLLQFAAIKGNFDDFSQALLRLDIDNSTFSAGLAELEQIAHTLTALGVDPQCYTFNTGIIRGLDYYTGTVFETKLDQAPQLGSICGGGRYENLVGKFARDTMPGVGMSIGITRLFSQALEHKLIHVQQRTIAQVVILPLTQRIDAVLGIATKLRHAGIATDIYLQTAAIKKKMAYAADLGVPYTIIIGDDELAGHQVTLKNMDSGEQTLLNIPQVIDTILETTKQ
jgi:histidyl-tRNA synthetase